MLDFRLQKITDCQWINLFRVFYKQKGAVKTWLTCSRKENPVADADTPDAVVIVPIVATDAGPRLVITKEFRIPIWDYEYGFPAGLIDKGESIEETIKRELKEETGLDLVSVEHISGPIYSSAGMSDESCLMAIVRAEGKLSNQWLEDGEDIEAQFMDAADIDKLLASGKKISAKAWGLFYHYAKTGKDRKSVV